MKKPGNAGGAKARQEGGCVESMVKQAELPIVEETSKQGREAESQKWSWVEAEVWTQRMLTTLETGVKGGRWFSLIDKVYRKRSLEAAWRKVRRRKGAGGVDGQGATYDVRPETADGCELVRPTCTPRPSSAAHS